MVTNYATIQTARTSLDESKPNSLDCKVEATMVDNPTQTAQSSVFQIRFSACVNP
jgi:hypothetical protein